MADDYETLKLRWREEAQAAIAQAQAEGEARGREAAAAENSALRKQIEELGQQSNKANANGSNETAQQTTSRRAKSYLNELYGRLKEAGPDNMRSCVAGELATLTALLEAVALEASASGVAGAAKPAVSAEENGKLEPVGSTPQQTPLPAKPHELVPTTSIPQEVPPTTAHTAAAERAIPGVVKANDSGATSSAPQLSACPLPKAMVVYHALELKAPSVCLWAAVVDTQQHRDGMFGHYIAYAIKLWAAKPLPAPPVGPFQLPKHSPISAASGSSVSTISGRSSSSTSENGAYAQVVCRREQALESGGNIPHGLSPSDPTFTTPMVHKRYSEFAALHETLTKAASGCSSGASDASWSTIAMVPLLPPKKATAAHRHFEASFVAERQRALSLWLQHVTGHPSLVRLPPLATFCSGSSTASVPPAWTEALSEHSSSKASSRGGGNDGGRIEQRSHACADSELKKVALGATNLSKSMEHCLEATKQLKKALHSDVSALDDFGRAALSFKSGNTPSSLSSSSSPSNPFTDTSTSSSTSSQVEKAGPTWSEAQCFGIVGEAAVAVEVASAPMVEALLVGCVEPLRFQARCGVESAKVLVEKVQKKKGSELEEMAPGVCLEWQRLGHLRGACLTVGFADTVRVLANSAAQAKAAWSEAAASLDDLLLDHNIDDGETEDKSRPTSFESAWEKQQAADAAAVSALLLSKSKSASDSKGTDPSPMPKTSTSSERNLRGNNAGSVPNHGRGSGVGSSNATGSRTTARPAAAEEEASGRGAHDNAPSFMPPPPPMRATIKRGLRRLPSQFVRSLKDFGMASIAALVLVAAEPPSRYKSITSGSSNAVAAATLNDAYSARAQAFARSEADKRKAEHERQPEAGEHRKSTPPSSSRAVASSAKPIRLKDAAAGRKDGNAPAIVRPALATPKPASSSSASSSAPAPLVVPANVPAGGGGAAAAPGGMSPPTTAAPAPATAANAATSVPTAAPTGASSTTLPPLHVPVDTSHLSAKEAAKAAAAQASLAASAAPLPPPMPKPPPAAVYTATATATASTKNEMAASAATSADSTGSEPLPSVTATGPSIGEKCDSEPLPEGWQEVKQENGGPSYFYHTRTRMSRWQKPDPAVAAEIEARYQAEEKATAEAQALRVHERAVASAAAAALDQEAQALKRQAEASVAAWQRKRALPVLLGDLQVIYPNAPKLLQSDSSSSSNATVSSSEVKKAYMKAARVLHPDKVQAGSTGPDGSVVTPQVAAKAAVLFTALAALYEDYMAKADT